MPYILVRPLSRPARPDQLTVKGRVSVRGAMMIGGQRIQVGLTQAGKTTDVTIETDIYRINAVRPVSAPQSGIAGQDP